MGTIKPINTLIELYEAYLYDANKEESPAVGPDDFSSHANKAINQVFNKFYATDERLQQDSDNLRALYRSVVIDSSGNLTDKRGNSLNLFPNNTNTTTFVKTADGWSFDLFIDYFHLKGITGEFDLGSDYVCNGSSSVRKVRLTRTTTQKYNNTFDNVFQKEDLTIPSPRAYAIQEGEEIELKLGNVGTINKLFIDYIRVPSVYTLTDVQVNERITTGNDTSQILEFPGYINYEILREINTLVLARDADQRLSTIPTVSQSVTTI